MLTCSPTPGKIVLVLVAGEQETSIRDDAATNAAITNHENRHQFAVTMFGDSLYLLRIHLACPSLYGRDSFDTDCNLAHHVDVWIDLNDDGKFDEFENRVHRRSPIESKTPRDGYDVQILIPVIDGTHTKVGPHRMRLSVMRSEAYRRDCGEIGYSETRDYTVYITQRTKCAGKI